LLQAGLLLVSLLTASSLLGSTQVCADVTIDDNHIGAYLSKHNYGYVMSFERDIRLATYDARLIFHLTLPDWQIEFVDNDIDCRQLANRSVGTCARLRALLQSVRKARTDSQQYITQQVRRIHAVISDLPLDDRDRTRRGLLTEILARATGLASQDDLSGVK